MVPRLALTVSLASLTAVFVTLPARAADAPAAVETSPAEEFVSTLVTPLAHNWRTWTALGLTGSAVLLAACAMALKAPPSGLLLTSTEAPAWVVPVVQAGLFIVAISLGVAGAVMFLWPSELMDAAAQALSQRGKP